MRKVMPLVIVLGLLVAAAPKDKDGGKKEIHKDWPTSKQIEKADNAATFDSHNTCHHTNGKGQKISFVPADIGHLNDEERGKGCIIGKFETERNTGDGLTPGTYRVYLRKHDGKWQVFFCQKNEPVENSKVVKFVDDNEHKPKFTDAGTELRYWKLNISL
jgi:hypothetical protein